MRESEPRQELTPPCDAGQVSPSNSCCVQVGELSPYELARAVQIRKQFLARVALALTEAPGVRKVLDGKREQINGRSLSTCVVCGHGPDGSSLVPASLTSTFATSRDAASAPRLHAGGLQADPRIVRLSMIIRFGDSKFIAWRHDISVTDPCLHRSGLG